MTANVTTKAHYYEHYPHYMGTMTREFTFNIEEVDAIYDEMKADKNDTYEWAEKADELGDAYAFNDIVREWAKIRKVLEKKGEWGGEWEEGSHAISMNSMKEARATVGKIEVEVFERCGEW